MKKAFSLLLILCMVLSLLTVCAGSVYADGTDYTVTFTTPDGITPPASMTINSLEGAELPTADAPAAYTFLGWVTEDYDNVTEQPSQILSGLYLPTADITLKALYVYNDYGENPPTLTLMTVNDTLSEGDKIVITAAGTEFGLYRERHSWNHVKNFTFTNNAAVILSDPKMYFPVTQADIGWYLGDNDNGWLYTPANTENLSIKADNSNFMASFALTTYEDHLVLMDTIDYNPSVFYLSCRTNISGTNQNQWAMVNADSISGVVTLDIYKLTEGGTPVATYTTIVILPHEHDPGAPVVENEVPASCTAAGGYDTVVYCTVCGQELSRESTVLPALGHDYVATVTPPTETQQGYTTHVCSRCGDTYVDDYTDPLGSEFPVHFSVPAGVTKPADMVSNTNTGITLPTVEGPEGYSFLGWVTEDYDNVETLPATILTGTYIAPQEITLKALFTYTEAGTGVVYELLTAAPADWTGNYVITNNTTSSGSMYVLKGVSGSANGTNIESSGNCTAFTSTGITLDGSTMSGVAEDYRFTLAANGSNYTLQSVSTGAYYGMNSSSYLTAYTDVNSSYCGWTPAINASGVVQLKNAANGSYPYFSWSSNNHYFWSGSSSNANVLKLYRETPVGTAYYTTIIGEAHVHTPGDPVVENRVEPTCIEVGSYDEVVYCTDCGEELSRTHITVEALGHLPGEAVQENYVEPTATEYGGYDTVVYCQRCNAELSREHTVLEPTGTPEPELNEDLSFYTSISIGVEIKTTFTIRQTVLNDYASWYLEVSKLDDQGEPTETKRFGEGQEGAVTNVNNVAWRAVYTDITAKEMGVSFAATLHVFDANGQEHYSNTVTNTVKDYIVGELVKTDNENAVRTLCADMLNYGAAAQVYFEYDTDNLVNENLSAAAAAALDQFETKTEAPATLVNGSNGPNLYGSVSIKNRVVLSITARNLGAEGTVQIQVKKQGSNEVKEILETTKVGSVYSAKFSNVEANEMRDMFEFTALVDGVETGTPLLWSVDGYVRAARLNADTSAEELALLNALLIYTDSAAAVMS